jgi:hypothetical protein
MTPSSERRLNALAVGVMLIAAGVVLFAGWRLTGSEFLVRDCSFSSSDWADARDVRDRLERYAELQPMAEDVEECDLVLGDSMSQVRGLLGDPDDTRKPRHGRSWAYDLGSAYQADSDPHQLYLEFGDDDRVVLVSES